ncbi:DUF4349 domain-containing protein [Georgenia deserti]|uniref:DUF4349 domain-containing protein n=1 Tax=Georgenia deserti TaxID=2093781 RepID=A0ABW4L3A0_9MICO
MTGRWWKAFLGLLALIVALGACSGGGVDSAEPDQSQAPADQGGAESAAAGDDGANREVITTAHASLVVADPSAAADEVVTRAEDAGGYVEQRHESTDEEGEFLSAAVTARIPADALAGVLDALEEVGEVRSLDQQEEDVTQAARDLDARITALETSVDRLLEIMADAEDTSTLLEAESTLSERQADLEALRSEREHLSDQVAMSTLRVDLEARDQASVDPGGFLGGIQSGWNALLFFLDGLLLTAGALLPWLVVLGIPALAVFWLLRRRRRKRAGAAPREVSAT